MDEKDVKNRDELKDSFYLRVLALGLTYVDKEKSEYVPFPFKFENEVDDKDTIDNFDEFDLKYDNYR